MQTPLYGAGCDWLLSEPRQRRISRRGLPGRGQATATRFAHQRQAGEGVVA